MSVIFKKSNMMTDHNHSTLNALLNCNGHNYTKKNLTEKRLVLLIWPRLYFSVTRQGIELRIIKHFYSSWYNTSIEEYSWQRV